MEKEKVKMNSIHYTVLGAESFFFCTSLRNNGLQFHIFRIIVEKPKELTPYEQSLRALKRQTHKLKRELSKYALERLMSIDETANFPELESVL